LGLSTRIFLGKKIHQACGPWSLAVGPFLRMKRLRGSRGFTRRGSRWLKNFTTDGEDEEQKAGEEGSYNNSPMKI